MEFGTSIHCIDGRIQEPLINYIKEKYNIKYIDFITEPGPCNILSQNIDHPLVESIEKRIAISLNIHNSKVLFISGHYDCAGNSVPKEIQVDQIFKSEDYLQLKYPNIVVVKLWVNKNWEVEEL